MLDAIYAINLNRKNHIAWCVPCFVVRCNLHRSWEPKMRGHRTMLSLWFSLAEMMTSSPRRRVSEKTRHTRESLRSDSMKLIGRDLLTKWYYMLPMLLILPQCHVYIEVVPDVEGYREVMQRYREERHVCCILRGFNIGRSKVGLKFLSTASLSRAV